MPEPTAPQPALPARRALCSHCQRPLRTCLCRWIRPTQNQVQVLVLQHPDEADHAKGSARLLRLSLAQCHCLQGLAWAPEALPKGLLEGAALLYPAAPGSGPAQTLPGAPEKTTRLVVLDGTWRQSRQMLRANPWLLALPRVALLEPPPSLYGIRKAQRADHQRSTLEAACLALGALEGRPAHYQPLLQGFAQWVQALQRTVPRV